jgi:hypothetical protein
LLAARTSNLSKKKSIIAMNKALKLIAAKKINFQEKRLPGKWI